MAADEKRLQEIFTGLDRERREMLIEFAEFLQFRGGQVEAQEVPAPALTPRPENETVVAAIKRLSRSYSMLDKTKVLHQASALMAEHVLQGRDAVEVIDELELIFEQHYRSMTNVESG